MARPCSLDIDRGVLAGKLAEVFLRLFQSLLYLAQARFQKDPFLMRGRAYST